GCRRRNRKPAWLRCSRRSDTTSRPRSTGSVGRVAIAARATGPPRSISTAVLWRGRCRGIRGQRRNSNSPNALPKSPARLSPPPQGGVGSRRGPRPEPQKPGLPRQRRSEVSLSTERAGNVILRVLLARVLEDFLRRAVLHQV